MVDEALGSDYAPAWNSEAPLPAVHGMGTVPSAEGLVVASERSVPPPAQYEGGGIFPASTKGPSFPGIPAAEGSRQLPSPAHRQTLDPPGLDYAPPIGPPPYPFPIPPRFIPSTGPTQLPVPPGPVPIYPVMPVGEVVHDEAHTLGLSLVGLALGATAGTYYTKSVYGGIAGSLFAGAAVNGYRALRHYREGSAEGDQEAKISGTYAVGAAALAGFLWYKFVGPDYTPNEGPPKSQRYVENTGDCDIRRVGP